MSLVRRVPGHLGASLMSVLRTVAVDNTNVSEKVTELRVKLISKRSSKTATFSNASVSHSLIHLHDFII